jgi:uncharacterized protein (UPF0276 family)
MPPVRYVIPMRPRLPLRPIEAPYLGVGIGLRPPHHAELLARGAGPGTGIDWLEATTENFMVPGGRPRRILGALRELAPLALHGVSLNVGSVDPLDTDYLDSLALLARRVEPAWISDHLCWTGVGGHNLHDLLPLPHVEAAVKHVAARVTQVQERLGRRIALENVSTYLRFASDEMSEWEFLVAVAEAADCGILLDVNNVFVNACNHGFDARAFLDAIPPQRVFQIHLAGHRIEGPLRIDTHDARVCDEVWELFAYSVRRLGRVSTLIEWDDAIPPLAVLEQEAARARAILAALPAAESDARAAVSAC